MKKSQVVQRALKSSGLVSISRPATDEMLREGLIVLETEMLNLERDGVDIGFTKSTDPLSPDPNEDAGFPDSFVVDVANYIAVPICEVLAAPTTGRMQSMSMNSYRDLLASVTPAVKATPANMPSGAGNRRYCNHENYYLSNAQPEQSQ